MSDSETLYLASTSPRRREILRSIGVAFEALPVQVDESPLPGESPSELVLRLAKAKAKAADVAGIVLGSDTVVVLDNRMLCKPTDCDDAIAMLLSLAGRSHQVLTGVAVRSPGGNYSALSATEVRFREIDRDEALAYWHSGEPADKAGAYGIQGRGGMFVESISGSYSGVMGLPVFETVQLLQRAGIEVLTKTK